MKSNVDVTYIGGPTIILEINGLRLITDPTLDAAGEMFMKQVKCSANHLKRSALRTGSKFLSRG